MNRRSLVLVGLLGLFTGTAFAVSVDPSFWQFRWPDFSTGETPEGKKTEPRLSKSDPSSKTPETVDAPRPDAGSGAFDIARVDPDGVSVFAGRAEPFSEVVVLENDVPVGTTKADGNGEWTLTTEYKFSKGDSRLSLETRSPALMAETPAANPKDVAAVVSKAPPKDTATPAEPPSSPAADRLLKDLETLVAEAREEARKAEPERSTSKSTNPEVSKEPTAKEQPSEEIARAPPTPDRTPETSRFLSPDTKRESQPISNDSVQPKPKPETAAEKTDRPDVAEPRTPSPSPKQDELASTTPDAARTPKSLAERKSEPKSTARTVVPPETPPSDVRPRADRSAQRVIPIPVMFQYNSDTFTTQGEKAAGLLLEYVRIKKFPKIVLSGHADERGGNPFNVALSQQRLQVVAAFLRTGGYSGKLDLLAKGETEPFLGVDRTATPQEELFQLDRRVELRLGG